MSPESIRIARFAVLTAMFALVGCAERVDADREAWDIFTIQGDRAGYGHTSIKHVTVAGRRVVRIQGLQHLVVKRFGQTTELEIRFRNDETPDGKLLDFTTRVGQGPGAAETSGRVVGNRLKIETTTQGKKDSTSIAWKPQYGGFYAAEMSLLRRPMKPGERRTVEALVVGFSQVAALEMTARDLEPVELLTGTVELLRIDTVTRFSVGDPLEGTLWTDPTGETLKTFTRALQITTLRVAKEVALQKTEPGNFDLGRDIAVKLARAIDRPHETSRIRYRVRLEGGDPAAVFVTGPSQAVRPIDANTAEVTVDAIRPGRRDGNRDAPDDPPTDADRQPNNWIQSDDPIVAAEAKKAAGSETDPWRVAVALERYVHDEVTEKDFSQAFATAADVARTRQGDCTEHAVFLTALGRARGIPARIAFGLVYMEGTQSFGYHAWTEMYLRGRWIPLDATLAKGGIGAGHLKLGHSTLEGASAYSSLLPVIQVAGRLKIEKL